MGVDQTALRLPAASITEIPWTMKEPVCVNGPTVAVSLDPEPVSLMVFEIPLISTVA